jgi:invasion protein IalB
LLQTKIAEQAAITKEENMMRIPMASLAALLLAALSTLAAPAYAVDPGITDKRILIGQTVSITGQVAGAVKARPRCWSKACAVPDATSRAKALSRLSNRCASLTSAA